MSCIINVWVECFVLFVVTVLSSVLNVPFYLLSLCRVPCRMCHFICCHCAEFCVECFVLFVVAVLSSVSNVPFYLLSLYRVLCRMCCFICCHCAEFCVECAVLFVIVQSSV